MLDSVNVRPLVAMLTGQQVAWLSKHVAEARAQKADWSMEPLADYLVGRSQTGHQYDVAFYGSMLQHHEVGFQGSWSSMLRGGCCLSVKATCCAQHGGPAPYRAAGILPGWGAARLLTSMMWPSSVTKR